MLSDAGAHALIDAALDEASSEERNRISYFRNSVVGGEQLTADWEDVNATCAQPLVPPQCMRGAQVRIQEDP
jgi:hypothetical protein